MIPTSPTEIPAEQVETHRRALLAHHLGTTFIVDEQRHTHLLADLACSRALADRALDTRWPTAISALDAGIPVDVVARATGLTAEELRGGITAWVDGQLRGGRVTVPQANDMRGLLTERRVTR